MKFLLPIILLVASGVIFFGFVDPAYTKITELRAEEKLFNEALDNSAELQKIRDSLRDEYNTFSTSDLDKLKKLLPNNVDNVRLVRDLDGIASQYGMSLYNVNIEVQEGGGIEPTAKKFGSVNVVFTVRGSYDTFLAFLRDLEKSLRIVDIVSVSFTAAEQDLYEYKVSLRTYWLK